MLHCFLRSLKLSNNPRDWSCRHWAMLCLLLGSCASSSEIIKPRYWSWRHWAMLHFFLRSLTLSNKSRYWRCGNTLLFLLSSESETIKQATLLKLSALDHVTFPSSESEIIKTSHLFKLSALGHVAHLLRIVRLLVWNYQTSHIIEAVGIGPCYTSLSDGEFVSVWNSSNHPHALNLLQTLWWHYTHSAYLIYLLQPFYIWPKSKFARFLNQTVTKQYFRRSSITV